MSTSYDLINQAITHLFIGFGLALLNVIIRYFAPVVPHVITVLTWKRLRRALIAAYMIALALQLVTSPFFSSLLHPVSIELAWSPYQAIFNVLGVMVMDLIVLAWGGLRRGADAGRKQLEVVKERAADGLDEMGARLALTPEGRDEAAARAQAKAAADSQAASERKQRMDDRLKDY
jgi:Na+/proline symporter